MSTASARHGRRAAITPSHHAARRYIERIAGNVSLAVANERLERLVAKARFAGTRPGGAREYRLGWMRFIVADGLVLTVYQNRA